MNSGFAPSAPAGSDLDGNPRIAGGTVDMGAYEFQGAGLSGFTAWLWQYGLRINGSADNADPDGDGLSNWQECVAGTPLTDASSALRVFSPTSDRSGAVVSWQSESNVAYYLEGATDLGSQAAFSSIVTNILGQSGTMSFTDTNAIGPGPFF